MTTHTSHNSPHGGPQPTGFTRETQRKLTAMRVVAYSLASLFMIVMVVRGVWLTRDQMEAEANRSIGSAAAALTVVQSSGSTNPAKVEAILRPLTPAGVVLRVSNGLGADQGGDERLLQIGHLFGCKLARGESSWFGRDIARTYSPPQWLGFL